jgi:hypothetical protein
MRIELISCAVFSLVACTSEVRRVSDVTPYVPRQVVVVTRWDVQHHGEDLGSLVLLEIRDPSGPIRFYRVVNRGGQWVGHVALDGRFSRRVPFQEDEEDLGIYSMNNGLAVLYQVDQGAELSLVERRGTSEASVPRVHRQ